MKFSGTIYLDREIVLDIHKLQLEEHGGITGVRDHRDTKFKIVNETLIVHHHNQINKNQYQRLIEKYYSGGFIFISKP